MTQDLELKNLLPHSDVTTQETKVTTSLGRTFWSHLKRGIQSLYAQTVKHYGLLYSYLIPAGLYACYDVLAYVNLRKFDASTYFLLLQFRLVVTGLLHQCMFNKKLCGIQWIALLIITFGCCIKTASEFYGVRKNTSPPKLAYASLMLQILCSTFAGVYNEVLLKRTLATLNVQNIFMYVDSTLCTLFFIAAGVVESSEDNLTVFSMNVLPLITIMACIGVVTSLFLQCMDSIRKAIASALELLLRAISATVSLWYFTKSRGSMHSKRNVPKTAIAMMNMGGPSTLNEVGSFLENLFCDPEIIPMGKAQSVVGPWIARRRTPKITEQYAKIGGGSPILKWTNIQGEEMCRQLDSISPQTAPHKHYVFFRYANPQTEASLLQMREDGVERVVAFSQYPQWSCTTTGSSLNQLWREIKRLKMENTFKWSLIDRWNTDAGYIEAVTQRVRLGLEQFAPEDRHKVIIMFSAHSLPMKVVYKGDPYVKEIASTTERVMDKLQIGNSHILAWQSKVGFLPWMGPSTSDVLKGFGKQGQQHVLAVPIAFTSDHIETLYEIDIEYAEEAKEAGILHFKRSPSLNDEPLLLKAMANRVKKHLEEGELHSPQYPLPCPKCTNAMCRTILNPISNYSVKRDRI
ncbi:unnamed protein product [Albugo candida]|uniref:Ferrochelatase, mitochondrial n=1 Tax=Albugo candida TaxID=65357 RepID=A0A024GMP6_9STRA|nr:unnamed protein product [Albugo candida]|eukprot:CCI47618.1 unnamed protein product [Albugo candida]